MASIEEMIKLANYQAGPGRLTEEHKGGPGAVGVLMSVLQGQKLKIENELKKKQEAATKKADMYKTLREAGYDSKSAYDAVMKGDLVMPGAEDTPLKMTTRERIMNKISKGETLSSGEQQVYDETIKHKEGDIQNTDDNAADVIAGAGSETATQKTMREKILAKIAEGKSLTTGEQKIYDETIKKDQSKLPDNSAAATINKTKNEGQDEMIPVIAPDGRIGSIPKSKLAAALAAGWKKR